MILGIIVAILVIAIVVWGFGFGGFNGGRTTTNGGGNNPPVQVPVAS
jgi:hypothetical protein